MKNPKYFQFPLCLLQNVLSNSESGIGLIICFSVINRAKKTNYSMHDVSRQLMYDYYRNLDVMEDVLQKKFKKYIKQDEIILDEDYNGFVGIDNTFNPETNIKELQVIFRKDKEFEEFAIFHYQITCAAKLLNVQLGDIDNTIDRYEEALKQINHHQAKFGNDPMPGITTDLLWDVKGKKNNEEVELLCALTAIRSIIGQRSYSPTYKNVILMRMIGAKSKKALEECLNAENPNKNLKIVYEKYSNRYHMDKMIEKLRERKFIQSKIALGRKIYFSTKLSMNELENVLKEERKKKNFKKVEAEARKRILMATV